MLYARRAISMICARCCIFIVPFPSIALPIAALSSAVREVDPAMAAASWLFVAREGSINCIPPLAKSISDIEVTFATPANKRSAVALTSMYLMFAWLFLS